MIIIETKLKIALYDAFEADNELCREFLKCILNPPKTENYIALKNRAEKLAYAANIVVLCLKEGECGVVKD